jgi:hypothetical protein
VELFDYNGNGRIDFADVVGSSTTSERRNSFLRWQGSPVLTCSAEVAPLVPVAGPSDPVNTKPSTLSSVRHYYRSWITGPRTESFF